MISYLSFPPHIRHIIYLIILVLPACVSHKIKEPDWPESLPSRAYFLSVYEQDLANKNVQSLEKYLTWVTRFYLGWELYPDGWNSITQQLSLRLKNPQVAKEAKVKMERLGLLISGEWGKNNKIRKINTRHVSIWGNALLKSLDRGETLQLLDRVAVDVDGLLSRKISAGSITADRYYAPEDIDF